MEKPGLTPSGIAGWLILPVLSTFASAVYLCLTVWVTALLILHDGKLVLWGLGDFIFLPLAVGWIFACFLLITKRRRYPALFVALSGLLFLYSLLIFYIYRDEPLSFAEFLDQWETPYLFNALLIPYMLLSKRVKNTFVN